MKIYNSRLRRVAAAAFTGMALSTAMTALHAAPSIAKEQPLVEVWKDPSCGCCGDWVKHMEKSGFKVKVNNIGNSAMRARSGVPQKYASCHTSKVGDYVIEGHVPAADIQKLLKEKPSALGLVLPGMPLGSPGMGGPATRGRPVNYDVLLLEKDGKSRVFQNHKS